MKKLIALAPIALSLFLAGAASADDSSPSTPAPDAPAKAHASARRGIVDLPPIVITSPPMRPLAAIAVSQIQPRLTLVELRQPFLSRIEGAIFADHF